MGFEGSQGAMIAARSRGAPVSPLDGRFLIWRGASGRVYVFSPVDDEMPLDDALLISVERDRAGHPIRARPRPDPDRLCGEIWAHHLASTPAERRVAAVDLSASGRAPEVFEVRARS